MNNAPDTAIKVTASLNVPKRAERSPAPIVIKYILAAAGCIGSVVCFLSCFDVGAGTAAPVITAIVACAVFTLALNMKPALSGKASVGAAAFFLLLTFIFRYEICAGIANTVNIYLHDVREHFFAEPFLPIAEPELAGYHAAVFFVFLTALLSMITAYLSSRSSFAVGMCLPLLMPPAAAMMFGFEPNYGAFAAVVAVCAAAIALEISSSEKASAKRRSPAVFYSGLTAAVLAAAVFGAVALYVKLSGYSRPEELDKLYDNITGYVEKGEMQSALNDIVTVAVKKTIHTGAINHGKLGEFSDISFDNETVLRATMPKSDETVYLRGFVGTVYTGRSWERLSSSKQRQLRGITDNFSVDGLSPLLLDGYNLKLSAENLPRYGTGLPKHSFTVKNISAGNDYLYMPYNLVPESVSHYAVRDDGSFRGGESSYVGQFYDPAAYYGYRILFRKKWSIPTALAADEAAYRNFVYENYMELPENLAFAEEVFGEDYYKYITAEDGQTGKSVLDEVTVFNRKLYYIKKWLRENCEYSLSAGRLPYGEDFVNYFMENRKGSCSHFASAAAIMCRYAGIPARYVEGYIIKPGDFPANVRTGETVDVDITDARGHAWVEIYIDGFGWYPVEFTSGYGNVRTAIPTETAADEPESALTEITETEFEPVTEPSENAAESSAGGNAVSSTVTLYTSQESENTIETTPPQYDETDAVPNDGKRTVGFGVFGIKGGEHVDVYYDLTPLLFSVLGAALVPLLTLLRRRVILYAYRRKCASGEKAAALAAYKKFGRLIRLMKLPEQGERDYGEYAKVLSDGSPLLSDGSAEAVIGAALKASFGGGQLTSDEAGEAVSAVNALAKRYSRSLDRFGRLMLKYFYCII